MNNIEFNQKIKSAVDRMVDVYRKRPSAALSTASLTGEVGDGVACRITDGTHSLVADMPQVMGGDDAGPTPGFYARAGIVGCVSMGIKMLAVRAGHDFRRVRVRIENDFDDCATYGFGDNTAAPVETRVSIEVDCDLDENELEAFIEDVLEHDTWFLALRDAQSVKTRIESMTAA